MLILTIHYCFQSEKGEKDKDEGEEKKFDGSGPDHELVEMLGEYRYGFSESPQTW